MYFDLQTPKNKPPFLKTPVPFLLAVFVVVSAALVAIWVVVNKEARFSQEMDSLKIAVNKYPNKISSEEPVSTEKEKWHFNPGPISMDLIKKNGCVADGFLSDYGNSNKELTKMINRSECIYLHRALETWLRPPNFDDAEKIMEKVDKKPVVYGMFLAEAISTWRSYSDPNWDHDFKFDKMCQNGTEDRWEKNSCIPSIDQPEYRRYLKSITHRAMDIGIQSFLFGQIQLQDEHPNYDETEIKKVLADMRAYAKEKKMQIIIGAQTNNVTDERYLRLFDYIEGGVGIDSDGNIEDGACSSRFGNCWALLWNDRYSRIANDVLLNLDWSGMTWDDMGIFARMDQDKRIGTLRSLYQKFTSEKLGFMMPFLAVLNQENDGCYGPNKHFYAPSNKFKCKDEDAINKILKQNFASL